MQYEILLLNICMRTESISIWRKISNDKVHIRLQNFVKVT